jgi:Ca2+:H+ antiporter
VARKILWASLFVLPSLSLVTHYIVGVGQVADFLFAALALLPLAWVIGEATEHAAEHTGAGIGGFLNASFGNAPELIIALIAVADGLRGVVRGTITGSVVSNLLLVLGIALTVGHGDARARRVDRHSLLVQLALVLGAVAAFLFTSVPGQHGYRDRHTLAVASIPVALVLLAAYAAVTVHGLRRHRRLHAESGHIASESGWTLTSALTVLAAATVVTALVSEILVHSLAAFADAVGLSTFFTSAVIVAIVGNAAEHGGAIVIAWRGKYRLPSEIAVSSAAQVALLVAPLVVLLSFVVRPPLGFVFRPVELATMGGAAVLVALVVRDERVRRWEGFMLLAAYLGCVVWYWLAGDLPG